MYLGVVNFENWRLEVLENTFNLHFNSTYAQEVWSLNQFTCMCSRENKRMAYTHIHTIFIHFHALQILYVSLLIFNWLFNWTSLLGHFNWVLVCGIEWYQKVTNKTLTPMGLGFFCQLLTSPKLLLIIFNTTI